MLTATHLSKPFGPLEEECLAVKIPRILKLTSVMMRNNDLEHVGLDATEYLLPPTDLNSPWQRCMNENIRVYGILQLEKLEWLSEKGHDELRDQMRRRDNEGLSPDSRRSTLDPRAFYSNPEKKNTHIKIIISFKKNMNARNYIEEGQLFCTMFSSERKAQIYRVVSMQAECYQLSLNWFHRYQLFHLTKALAKNADVQQTIEERTISWFIEQYRRQYRHLDEDQRIIYDYSKEDDNIQLNGTVKRKRFLRHLADADLRGRFAEQCEWLLANQIASSRSTSALCFDTATWVEFCKKVKKDRAAAEQKGERWGIPPNTELHELDFPIDDPFGLGRFGGSSRIWQNQLKLALKPKTKEQPKRVFPVLDAGAKPDFSASKSKRTRKRGSRPVHAIYDPAFSEDSSEGEPESEWEWEPDIVVPAFCLQAPSLAPGRNEWHCPGSGCHFTIDLLKMTSEDTVLKRVSWPHTGQSVFIERFELLVHKHYTEAHIPLIELDGDQHVLRNAGRSRPISRHRRSDRLGTKKPRIKTEDH